jgi:hypothetical protein
MKPCVTKRSSATALSPPFTDDDRRAVLDRLVDLELLREQMKSADFRHATNAEVAARIADARKQYPQASFR